MFSITPENPLLELFYKLIPHKYWYMLLSLIVVVIYLGIIYVIHYRKEIFHKKQNELV